ncbi:MAG: hypothetical protein IT376_05575 [Polyangiaceae bacterium]|nr:hypothetical protein [Polyangiaceae bacterium]
MLLTDGRFGGRDPHLVHGPSGFRVWLTEPTGMLTQVGEQTSADEEVARFLSETAYDRVLARRRGSEPLLFLHDWTRLQGYSSQARSVMTTWALAVRTDAARISVALAPQAKLVRMGVSVAAVSLQLVGFELEVVESLERVFRELGVRPAP